MDVVYFLSFPFHINLICSKTMRSAQVSEQLIGWVIMLLIVPLLILHKKFVYKIEKNIPLIISVKF